MGRPVGPTSAGAPHRGRSRRRAASVGESSRGHAGSREVGRASKTLAGPSAPWADASGVRRSHAREVAAALAPAESGAPMRDRHDSAAVLAEKPEEAANSSRVAGAKRSRSFTPSDSWRQAAGAVGSGRRASRSGGRAVDGRAGANSSGRRVGASVQRRIQPTRTRRRQRRNFRRHQQQRRNSHRRRANAHRGRDRGGGGRRGARARGGGGGGGAGGGAGGATHTTAARLHLRRRRLRRVGGGRAGAPARRRRRRARRVPGGRRRERPVADAPALRGRGPRRLRGGARARQADLVAPDETTPRSAPPPPRPRPPPPPPRRRRRCCRRRSVDRWDREHVRLPCSPRHRAHAPAAPPRRRATLWHVLRDVLSPPPADADALLAAMKAVRDAIGGRWKLSALREYVTAFLDDEARARASAPRSPTSAPSRCGCPTNRTASRSSAAATPPPSA